MKQNQNRNSAESLKRSHSASSNAKLTLVCLLCTLSLTLLLASLATLGTGLIAKTALTVTIAVSGLLSVLSLAMLSAFKR